VNLSLPFPVVSCGTRSLDCDDTMRVQQVFAGGDSDDEEDAINDGTVFDTVRV
jgi:hypothetical protein